MTETVIINSILRSVKEHFTNKEMTMSLSHALRDVIKVAIVCMQDIDLQPNSIGITEVGVITEIKDNQSIPLVLQCLRYGKANRIKIFKT